MTSRERVIAASQDSFVILLPTATVLVVAVIFAAAILRALT